MRGGEASMVPDYYARLGVDPAPHGRDRGRAPEASSRPGRWGRGTPRPGTPTSSISTRSPRAAGPPERGRARAAYDAELAVAQIAEREQKLDELQRRVRLRAAKGGSAPSDRGLLGDEAARLGLTRGARPATRPIPDPDRDRRARGGDEADVEPPADVLDPSTRRQIRVALEHLGRRDLYDALACPATPRPRSSPRAPTTSASGG